MTTQEMQNFTPEDLCRHAASREQAWNIYLSSLDSHEIHVLCKYNIAGENENYPNIGTDYTPDTSWECFLHDMFVAGVLEEDDIGCRILILLGEL